MATYVNAWKEPATKRAYVCTGKEADPLGDKLDLACWVLAGKVKDEFMDKPATMGDIYHEVMRPLGMSLDDTSRLVKEAKKRGYLK